MVVVSALGLAALRNETVTVNRVEQGPLRQSVVASGRVRTPERIALAHLHRHHAPGELGRECDALVVVVSALRAFKMIGVP